MGWLYAAAVIFGVVFLAVVAIGTGLALRHAIERFEIWLFMLFTVGVAGIAASLFAWFPAAWAQTHYNERVVDCFVRGKDRGGKENDMRIYTSCGVFQNTDSILRGKNTSADVWSRIEPGKTQTFKVVGWRFGLTSDFPNVLDVR